ncbi:conserved hypothetical protein [Lactococcus piscium]|nr:conserved hypothetical protein [Lactococcus piscium]
METSESRIELFKAFANFKKKLKQPLKDADNPFFKSKYVPLENVVAVVDEAMEDTGLSYIQEIEDMGEGYIRVDTVVLHESGEFMVIKGAKVKPVKPDPQSAGSAITYARRYSLSAAFGIACDPDDDGNSASQKGKQNQQQPQKTNTNPNAKPTPKPQPQLTPEQKVAANIDWVNKKYKPEIELIKSWQEMGHEQALKAIKEYAEAMQGA